MSNLTGNERMALGMVEKGRAVCPVAEFERAMKQLAFLHTHGLNVPGLARAMKSLEKRDAIAWNDKTERYDTVKPQAVVPKVADKTLGKGKESVNASK